MQHKKSSSGGSSAQGAAPALDCSLESLAQQRTPGQFCLGLSRLFRVRQTEVALLRLEHGLLKFLFPVELQTAGAIPLSSSTAIAAHTATSKKVELYNSFLKVKHASVFESVKLSHPEETDKWEQPPIQRLMSAPVLDAGATVLGVVQICRKGLDLLSSGPEFTLEDLRQLESAASLAARSDFMRAGRGSSAI